MIDKLESALRSAARFNVLAMLYAGAAHELRAPLNSMVVYLELLKQSLRRCATSEDKSVEPAQQDRYIEAIQLDIKRLNNCVEQLLDLTAPINQHGRDVDLGQVLTEIAGLIRVQAKLQGVVLEWKLPGTSLRLNGQRGLICQVFLDIIVNALEAMPNGGVLALLVTEQDDFISIEIRDSGEGIPEPLQSRIFELHFTTKESHPGIGLHVARSVIEEHGGTLEVSSTSGKGACFRVRLPRGETSAGTVHTKSRVP